MTRFRRLVDDDDEFVVPPPVGIGSFGALPSLYDLERGLFRMQSADPQGLSKSVRAPNIIAKFGAPSFGAGTSSQTGSTTVLSGAGAQASALAGLQQIQAQTNHPPSPQKAAAELARLYDLFAKSAKPQALLTGRKQLMESTMLPAFMGNGPRNRIISTLVQAFTVYWLGAPVQGGGVVTGFLGGPELSKELNSIYASGSNSSQQIARRLARCFIVATRKVQFTLPGPVVGFMTVFPPLSL